MPWRWPNNMDGHFNTSHPTSTRMRRRNNWLSAMESSMARAQKFADRFANLNWPKLLSKYAKLVTPQLQDILKDSQHYWVTAQSELSTDILFKSRQHLSELYPELLSHGTLRLGAKDVMN